MRSVIDGSLPAATVFSLDSFRLWPVFLAALLAAAIPMVGGGAVAFRTFGFGFLYGVQNRIRSRSGAIELLAGILGIPRLRERDHHCKSSRSSPWKW